MTTLHDILKDFAQDVLVASQESADVADWQDKVKDLIKVYLGEEYVG